MAASKLWLLASLMMVGCAQLPEESSESGEPIAYEPLESQESWAASTDDGGVPIESSSQALQNGVDFCWKNNYGRGVGTVPDTCPGKQKDAGLCYPWCRSGYYGVGPVCWQHCPRGYTDDGAFCRRDAHIFSADNSQCPWYDVCGLTLAPGCSKCPAGYTNDGCTCRRDAHIFAKHSYGRGAGAPMSCRSNLEYDAGLCYNHCEMGYDGVGPVCWGECPADAPVECGAGCATSSAVCAEQVINQITSSLELAANIATGVSGLSNKLTKVALSNAKRQAMKDQVRDAFKDQLEDAALAAVEEAVVSSAEGEPFDWASLDPTGIAAVVEAFDAPACFSNVARGRATAQSSTASGGHPARAVDGNRSGNWGHGSVTHTANSYRPWWQVDVGAGTRVNHVVLYNRTDCCSGRLANFRVEVLNGSGAVVASRNYGGRAGRKVAFDLGGAQGRYVRVRLNGSGILSLAEVEVY